MFKKIIKFCWNNLIVRNLIFIILATFILFGIVMAYLGIYTRHGEEITLPDLRKLSIVEAENTLNRYGLRYEVIDSVYHKGAVPGSIIDQLPVPGSKVKENRIIYLTVNSKNVQKVTMPRIKDFSQRQAIALLTDMGFEVDDIRYVSNPYRDLVINVLYRGRTVDEGEKIPSGSKLTLLVGDGQYPVDTLTQDSTNVNESDSEEWFQ